MRVILSLPLLIVGLGLAFDGYSQSFLTNGLAAYYPFNGNANDVSGNGHQGVLNGTGISPTNNQIGIVNGALHFARGTYISVAPTPFDVNSNWTISFFCLLDLTYGVDNFICTGNDNANGVNMRYVFGSAHPWQFSQVNLGWDGSDAANSPAAWNMFTCVKNGSLYEMFLNDVLVSSIDVVATGYDTGSLWIGRHQGADYYLVGSLSDLRIYNRALADSEVQQLYQYQTSPPPPPAIGLAKAIKLSLSNLIPGARYQLQASSDLNVWTNIGGVFIAPAPVMTYPEYIDVGDWGQLFFRAQVAP